LDSDIV
jgi:hypothetical protein